MVMVDGSILQVKADGEVLQVSDEEKTPFATVTFFKAATDRKEELEKAESK